MVTKDNGKGVQLERVDVAVAIQGQQVLYQCLQEYARVANKEYIFSGLTKPSQHSLHPKINSFNFSNRKQPIKQSNY